MILSEVVLMAAGAADGSTGLDVANPLVLGPIAGFVFLIFTTEIIVSGKAYKREVEENVRLRTIVERVVPLAEQMVASTKEMADTTREVTRVMDTVMDLLSEEGMIPPSATRRRRG